MRYEEEVEALIEPLIVPEHQRLSIDECVDEDNKDTAIVLEKLDHYGKRVLPIAEKLESYTLKSFSLIAGSNGTRAQAREPGIIELDFATLNKSEEELAFTVSHEWGHHDLGHLRNKHVTQRMDISEEEAEHSADFYAGIFLGYHGYDLKKLLKVKLRMPDGDSCHGSRIDRAKIITRGFVLGTEMLKGNLELGFVPAYKAYIGSTGRSPWHVEHKTAYSEAVLSRLRNVSK